MRQNRPYGNVYEELMKGVFTNHSYRWTPIGNMEHLRAAPVNELQDFFNTYYVPNNAILVIAGDIDVARSKEMVRTYFGWIPRGPDVRRAIPTEPEQDKPRRIVSPQRVPLPAVVLGFRLPPYSNPDNDALDVLATLLGDGSSSRLDRALVNGEKPLAVDTNASTMTLEDGGVFTVQATVLQGKAEADVETALVDVITAVREKGLTNEELDKAKTQQRVAILHGRDTSDQLASQLGSEMLFANDPNRVNTAIERLDKVTVADVNRVARQYLDPARATTLVIKPDPLGTAARASATQAASLATAPVVPSSQPVLPRDVTFPVDYPEHAPTAQVATARPFEKGTEFGVKGVRVIVMPDHRLPLVNWNLTIRRGGHSAPADKLGVAGLTASLLTRGTKQQTFAEFSTDLESRGIGLDVSDGGDVTRVNGSSTTDQLAHGVRRTNELLTQPRFDPVEFDKLKAQTLSGLQLELETPAVVASRELMNALYGDTPFGRAATPQTVSGITLDDVRTYFAETYYSNDALLVFAGDVSVEEAKTLAVSLLGDWASPRAYVKAPPQVDYKPAPAGGPKLVLVDRPEGKQATVRLGTLAYDIRTDDKYAGAVANRILSGGIDGRMMKYVRAEKGLVYTAAGIFQPNRHGGEFVGNADTAVETTADAIRAMYTVIDKMRSEKRHRRRTVRRQAARRRFDADATADDRATGAVPRRRNFERLPDRLLRHVPRARREGDGRRGEGGDAEVRRPAALHGDGRGAAGVVEKQLKELGEVKVLPMPNKRNGATTQPATTKEMLKPPRDVSS
jgi:zinc protease